MSNDFKNIDLLLMMNDLQQFTQPVSTNVGISAPQGDFFKNQPKLAKQVGSPNNMIGGISQEELLDIVMSVTPVGASIRGGKVAKSTLHQLLGLLKKTGAKPPKGITAGDLRGKGLENILDRNIYSKARIQNQKALDKYGIVDPDKKGMVDPVTSLLNYFSKN